VALSAHLCVSGTRLNAENNSSFCSSTGFNTPESPQDLEAAGYKRSTVGYVLTVQSWGGVVGSQRSTALEEGRGQLGQVQKGVWH
jgi:hypothetical protein